ncbi:hypothetical protein [Pelobium manganitolerans]|uniref:hypothetical protein n=1 Tax=Pelobium manganitolerans TaxID=1842495 RepID=UPI003FA383AE
MPKNKYDWKIIVVLAIFFQVMSACRKDPKVEPDRSPLPVEDVDISDKLPQFNEYKLNPHKLFFANVIEGWILPDGTFRKPDVSTLGWTHPSVLFFKEKWNNHRYWMAVTPYPGGINQYENPTIFCSDDGVVWKEPIGIVNPIEKAPVEPGYNSDVNLLMDNGVLYCFWRGVSIVDPKTKQRINGRTLLYRSSTDGVHWSDKHVITSWDYQGIDLIAPSVLKENDNYYCYGVSTGEATPGAYYTNYAIRRTVVKNVDDIKVDKTLGYELVKIYARPWGEGDEPWHLEVKKFKDRWYMLVSTTRNKQYGSGGRLFLGYSTDGLTFTFAHKPLCEITEAYKSSFELYEGKKTGRLNIKLWRSTSAGWAIFYDEFCVDRYFE